MTVLRMMIPGKVLLAFLWEVPLLNGSILTRLKVLPTVPFPRREKVSSRCF